MSEQLTFSAGDRVRLGDGREGKIVGKRERAGFHGFIVEITSSIDSVQVGQTVAATATTMKKLSQVPSVPMQSPYATPPVEEIAPAEDEEKQKEMRKKELNYTRKQIQMLQQKITDLGSMVAQTSPNQPGGEQFEDLERIQEDDQERSEQAQETDLAQQEMNQERVLQDQQMRTQQQTQMQMQPTPQLRQSSKWVYPERANIKIAVNNIELECDVAATPHQQASGLQAYGSLLENRGLWFPFLNKRSASFHMGEVKFPIDIIFIDDSKINKIVANVRPNQMGSWASICTDVIEVNGGWCEKNNIGVGGSISTPLTGKKRASYSDIEKAVNTSWSAPQKARINSDKDSAATSYDTLRTITTAEGGDDFEQRMLATFPFLKSAQEHRQPDTTDHRQPGEIDGRNPQTRFLHHTTPDVEIPFGDGDPASVDPFDGGSNAPKIDDDSGSGNYGKHFHLQRGYDPFVFREEDHPHAVRPTAQVTIESPNRSIELDGIDLVKMAAGSVTLYETYSPEWHAYDHGEEYEGDPGYDKMAIVNDKLISRWIDSLGFDSDAEAKLRQNMFTDGYKVALGDTLVSAEKIVNYEIFDSDLLLYQ